MLVIPAIDLRGGLCVRLTQGDYALEKVYDSDPVRVAQEFEAEGAQLIHVVDLDGAKSGVPLNSDVIRAMAKALSIPMEVGGGVRSVEAAQRLLDLGVDRVVVGTKLVEDEALAQEMFERFADRVVAGIDARNGQVAVAGWTSQSGVSAVNLALRMQTLGAKRIILTDIAQDGMLTGPNLDLLSDVSSAVSIPVIHSGGIGSLDDLRILSESGEAKPEGVITGRAIYEGKFSVREAVAFCASLDSPKRN